MSLLLFSLYNAIQKFFDTIVSQLPSTEKDTFSAILSYGFWGAFILVAIIVIIIANKSYEVKLGRAIDFLNKYFVANPQIDEDNLVSFNEKMKQDKIPKILRKQWQQFMLYREHPASYYMSFKHCVENPLQASNYDNSVRFLSRMGTILAVLLIIFNMAWYVHSGETNGTFMPTQTFYNILLAPFLMMIVNWIICMILELWHNSVKSDLLQNYQYFEINLDKATSTMPEFVDYEVLFTKQEIKQGIPVLYEYLQKRAEQEKKELEKVRTKDVEHDKYNFDKNDIEGTLVLERAVSESEIYISMRAKYMQQIEQINTEIANLEMNYRNSTKEYQRKMQASKENLENLNKQMAESTSSIEINYIKKQQGDELQRQQILERDYDAVTDKVNSDIASLQSEIEKCETEIANYRKKLETALQSEFDSYSKKVYDKLENVVNENEKEKYEQVQKHTDDLEEVIAKKNAELDNMYYQYQQKIEELISQLEQKDKIISEYETETSVEVNSKKNKKNKKNKRGDEFSRLSEDEELFKASNSKIEQQPFDYTTYKPSSMTEVKDDEIEENSEEQYFEEVEEQPEMEDDQASEDVENFEYETETNDEETEESDESLEETEGEFDSEELDLDEADEDTFEEAEEQPEIEDDQASEDVDNLEYETETGVEEDEYSFEETENEEGDGEEDSFNENETEFETEEADLKEDEDTFEENEESFNEPEQSGLEDELYSEQLENEFESEEVESEDDDEDGDGDIVEIITTEPLVDESEEKTEETIDSEGENETDETLKELNSIENLDKSEQKSETEAETKEVETEDDFDADFDFLEDENVSDESSNEKDKADDEIEGETSKSSPTKTRKVVRRRGRPRKKITPRIRAAAKKFNKSAETSKPVNNAEVKPESSNLKISSDISIEDIDKHLKELSSKIESETNNINVMKKQLMGDKSPEATTMMEANAKKVRQLRFVTTQLNQISKMVNSNDGVNASNIDTLLNDISNKIDDICKGDKKV